MYTGTNPRQNEASLLQALALSLWFYLSLLLSPASNSVATNPSWKEGPGSEEGKLLHDTAYATSRRQNALPVPTRFALLEERQRVVRSRDRHVATSGGVFSLPVYL